MTEAEEGSGYGMQVSDEMIPQTELTGEEGIEVEMPETPEIVELD